MNLRVISFLFFFLILISSCSNTPSSNVIIEDVPDSELSEQKPEVKEEETQEPETELENKTETPVEEQTINQTETNQTQEPATQIIKIENKKFVPSEITIDAGTTVVWQNLDKDAAVHFIVVRPIALRSGRMTYGDSYEHIFDEPGEYKFIDSIFPDTMIGTLTVIARNTNN